MSSQQNPLTWLITGSSNGFGLALTRHVLASGDNVIATSRNPAKTPDLVKEIEAKKNGKWLALDVCWSHEKIKHVIEDAEGFFNGAGVDVVVNNAAFSVLGAVEDVSEQQAKAEFETNLWGPIRVCKAVLPKMRQRGCGTIINVSSALGITTWPACGLYSASKFALEGVSQALAAEASSFGVRVLIVEPGAFRTNFLAGGAMQVAEPSPPYQAPHVVAKSLQDERDKNGKQPGDADKAVKVIYDVVTGKNEKLKDVLRLPLGEDCWAAGVAQTKKLLEDFDLTKDVAHTVGFDQ